MSNFRIPSTVTHAIVVGRYKAFSRALDDWLSALPPPRHQAALNKLLHITASFAQPRKTFVFQPHTVDIARDLISRGADPNSRDAHGNTPAMSAFRVYDFGHETRTPPTRPMLRLLFESGADFDIQNDGVSVHTLARSRSMTKFIERLLLDRQHHQVKQSIINPLSARTFL